MFNTNPMWKKFVAVMAIVGVFSTSTVFAFNGDPAPDPVGMIVSEDLTLSDVEIDPTQGQTTTVSFEMTAAGSFYAELLTPGAGGQIIPLRGTNAAKIAVPAADTVTFTVFGTDTNRANGVDLADGTYTIQVFAVDANGANGDSATGNLEIRRNPVDADAPQITDFEVDPTTFDARDGEAASIDFEITEGAFVTVVIENSRGEVVRTFEDYRGRQSTFFDVEDNISLQWDGRETDGDIAVDGTYAVVVTVENNDGSNEYAKDVVVDTTSGNASNGVIEDVELDPSAASWDPDREELEISIDLENNVRRLLVRFEKGNEVIEIADDDYIDERDYIVNFDGVDDDGDFIREGVWNLVIWADADKVEMPVTVKYEDQEIVDSFVTKESFDPTEDEFTDLIVRAGVASNVTVELFNGNQKELTLAKDEPIRKNRYYSFRWDGMDRDGDEVLPGGNWRFKVTTENSIDDDVFSVEFVDVEVEEDDVSDRKANLTQDFVSPVIFDEIEDNEMEFSFCVDEDQVEVSLEIFENLSTSGNSEAELLDKVDFEAGCHTIGWNVRDEDDKRLKDGTYTYKLTAKGDSTSRDTELGRFVIGNLGNLGGGEVIVEPPTPVCGFDEELVNGECVPVIIIEPPQPTSNCGGYWDTAQLAASNSETCAAIDWVTKAGIFGGYQDGSFGPYNFINRAESLKAIFLATDAPLLPVDGSKAGFIDVQPSAWYMPYVRTAVMNNFLTGYSTPAGQVAGLDRNITRAEILKLALESASRFNGTYIAPAMTSPYTDVNAADPNQQWMLKYINVAYQNYLFNEHYNAATGQYALGANDLVQRSEVALLLYRMNNAGLLGGSYAMPMYDQYDSSYVENYGDNYTPYYGYQKPKPRCVGLKDMQ